VALGLLPPRGIVVKRVHEKSRLYEDNGDDEHVNMESLEKLMR
jgi:hypothetical protein